LDWMTWQLYFGTLDPIHPSRECLFTVIACEPDKVATMMEDLDSLPPKENASLLQAVERLKQKRHGMIVGRDRIEVAGKRVGDCLRLFGRGRSQGLNLEFEIVGVLPRGRYDTLAVMNKDYLLGEIDRYPQRHNGQEHPAANGSISVVWLRVRDLNEFRRLAAQIESSPCFPAPPVKCETSSSGVAVWPTVQRFTLGPALASGTDLLRNSGRGAGDQHEPQCTRAAGRTGSAQSARLPTMAHSRVGFRRIAAAGYRLRGPSAAF